MYNVNHLKYIVGSQKSKNDITHKPEEYTIGNYQEGTGFPYSPKIDLQILPTSDEDP
jgi:hypothetical protein